jgi:hypothetical protein
MGCFTSKTTTEQLRSHSALTKAHFAKKAQLDQDMNSLNIRQNYSKFNPAKRTFKQLKMRRKAMNTVLSNSRLQTRTLSKHPAKIHGSIPEHEADSLSRFQEDSQNLCELLSMTIDREETNLDLKVSRLIDLKNILFRKKRTFQKNKKKIEQAAIVKDLCEGKQKKSQFLKNFSEKHGGDRQTLRVDSISTAASESFCHAKNSFSMKIDDLSLEDVEISKLDLSMQIPSVKKEFCPKKCFKLSEGALLLRAKLLLKNDMERILNRNKKILKKKMKIARAEVLKLEKIDEAFETDPVVFMEGLNKEISVREQDLHAFRCHQDYLRSLISFGKDEESLSESPDELLEEPFQIIIKS